MNVRSKEPQEARNLHLEVPQMAGHLSLFIFSREIFFEIFFCEVFAGGDMISMYMLDIFVNGQSGVVVLFY